MISIPFVLVSAVCLVSLWPLVAVAQSPSQARTWTRWRVSNMLYCGGKPDQVVFDGKKSIVTLSKDRPCVLGHTTRYADLERDTFVLKLGKVSPGVSWEVTAVAPHWEKTRRTLMSGEGGGTHRAPFLRLEFPRWLYTDIELRLHSDKPATAEVTGWEIESPGLDPNAGQHAKSYSQLTRANPLERGLVPHWSSKMGAFVCAFNATHPEHYNFWLEDEGEALWSLGNYPDMMKLYGKGLRDFIVKYCRHGAPVRRVNDQPLLVYQPSAGGKFTFDTGLLVVEGDLSEEPRVNLHHGTYETGGLLARITGFYITYEDAEGVARQVIPNAVRDLLSQGSEKQIPRAARNDDESTARNDYQVQYDAPKRDAVQLVIWASDGQVSAEFTVIGYRGGVRVSAKIANLGDSEIRHVTAGFEVADCDKYYRSPLNSHRRFGDVAILWSEQPRMEFCGIVRVAGPAAHNPVLEHKEGNIARAGFSAEVADRVAKGSEASLELAFVQAGSKCFAEKIEIYKDMAFEDADISMSFVNTYALLGLATYCYRFPEDKEAREVVDLMIGNFLGARERLRNRELGYLMWVLDLLGRDSDAGVVADLVEKRAATESYTPHDMAGMAIGLRRVGRWEAADRICAALDKAWGGVGQPGSGEIDIFTCYRPPTGVLWNGKPLDARRWRYDAVSGTIRLTGLNGDGELAVCVSGPRPKDKWTPIDYIGLSRQTTTHTVAHRHSERSEE